jgi:hypothetical protein
MRVRDKDVFRLRARFFFSSYIHEGERKSNLSEEKFPEKGGFLDIFARF